MLKDRIKILVKEFFRPTALITFPVLVKDWLRLKEDFPKLTAELEEMYFTLRKLETEIYFRLKVLNESEDEILNKLMYRELFTGEVSLETLLNLFFKLKKVFEFKQNELR